VTPPKGKKFAWEPEDVDVLVDPVAEAEQDDEDIMSRD
jgi:hypothetical protein